MKSKTAISTPLPKAIIVAIIDLGKLDNKAKIDSETIDEY